MALGDAVGLATALGEGSLVTATLGAKTKKKRSTKKKSKKRTTKKSTKKRRKKRSSKRRRYGPEKISTLAPRIGRYEGAVAGGYNFWLYDPWQGEESDEPQPVIIFLHGASLCGGGMERARRYGPIHALLRGMDVPCAVIAPHNNGGAWKPERIDKVLEYAKTLIDIDDERIYVLGMSLGSYGTLDYVATYPEKVAAAMALCGGTSKRDFDGLAEVPLWIIHGTADRAVTVSKSREIVNHLRNRAGGAPLLLYDELPGVNHGQPCRMFYHSMTYDWLLSHTLDNRKVDKTYTISTEKLRSRYTLPSRDPNKCIIESRDEKVVEQMVEEDSVIIPKSSLEERAY